MRTIKLVLLLSLFNISIGITQAYADQDEGDKNACDGTGTLDMLQCNRGLIEEEDKKLNSLYKELRLKVVHGSRADKYLIDAQRAWLKFRNQSCQFESEGYEGGTLHGVEVTACELRITKNRNRELEGYLACTDNGCPGS